MSQRANNMLAIRMLHAAYATFFDRLLARRAIDWNEAHSQTLAAGRYNL